MSITTQRHSVFDFIAAVGAQTYSGAVYAASFNSDNTTLQITKNGAVLFAKILWFVGAPAAKTDLGGYNQDTVTVYFPEGAVGTQSASQFLATLN